MESDEEVEPVVLKRPAAKKAPPPGTSTPPDAVPDPVVEPARQKKPPIEAPVCDGHVNAKHEPSETDSTAPTAVEPQTRAGGQADLAAAVPPLKRLRTEGDETLWPPEKNGIIF